MVNSVKFSQFGTLSPSGTNTLVGLSNGANSKVAYPLTWTTATRPSSPNNGFSGYNTDLLLWEFWNGTIWQQFGTGDAGTVTQVDTGTGLTGGPITSSGQISFAPIAANSFWANTTGGSAVPTVTSLASFLLAANNLSDVPNKSLARSNLGVAIGTNVQAWSATLDQISADTWIGSTSLTTLGTITTGVWHGSTVTIPFGGTGNNTFTAYSVICAGTTSTGAFQNVSGVGTTGEVLTSNGPGLLPTWQSTTGTGTVNAGLINQLAWYAASGNTVSGLATANNGVLITSAGGVPSISQTLPAAVQGNITSLGTITSGVWTGTTIAVANGGTGDTSFTAYSVICGGITSTGALQSVASLGTSGQVLTSNGAGLLPTWQTVVGGGTVSAGLANQLAYYQTNGTTVVGLSTANGGLLVTNNTGVPSILAGSGTTGTVLQATSGGTPAWSAITYPSSAGTAGQILRSNASNTVYSTATFADTYAASSLLYSNGANTVTGLATANSSVLITSAGGVPSWSTNLPAGTTIGGVSPTGTVTSVATSGLATGGTITTSGTITVTAAVKSDQTTASSTSVAVVPGVQQYHPSTTKAWANYNSTTPAINASYNISGVVRNSTGDLTYSFSVSFADANYAVACCMSAGSSNVSTSRIVTLSAGSANLNFFNNSGLTNANIVATIFSGNQ